MTSSEPLDLPLHVETQGSGPPLVFLHGFGACAFTWRYWAPALAERFTVILVDLKGFGSAPRPMDGNYGLRDQAELVARLIVERELRDVTLVGHSLGGGLAIMTRLLLADQGEGDRVRRLVSVAGPAYPQDLPYYISLARRRWLARVLLYALPTRWLVRRIIRSVVHHPDAVTDEQVRGYAEPLGKRGTRHAVVETAMQILPEDLDDWVARYPTVDEPTLLLWGEGDAIVPPRIGRRLAVDLPRSELVVLPECGHIPPEEKPAESREVLESFLARTEDALLGA